MICIFYHKKKAKICSCIVAFPPSFSWSRKRPDLYNLYKSLNSN